MLHKLCRRLLENMAAVSQANEQRLAGFSLLRPRLRYLFGIDIHQRDRGLRTIELGVSGCDQHDLTVAHQHVYRILVPERTQSTGEFASGDGLQSPIQREESCVAAKISAA